MKYINSPIAMLALMFALGTAPAMAQTTDGETKSIFDTIIDTITGAAPEDDGTTTDGAGEGDDTAGEGEEEVDGNFSREIPEGLKKNLSDEDIAEYQARLDAAETPQERNEIRRELQRKAKESHLEKVQMKKEEKKEKKKEKREKREKRDKPDRGKN